MTKERDDLKDALDRVLKTSDGKRVIFWVLSMAGIYDDPFALDTPIRDYKLGQQSIGRRVLVKLDELDPRIYPRLLLEVADIEGMKRAAARNKKEVNEDEVDA